MLWKIIILFLCAMVLVGMVGKLLFPAPRARGGVRGATAAATCARCGRPRIGKGPCPCKGGK